LKTTLIYDMMTEKPDFGAKAQPTDKTDKYNGRKVLINSVGGALKDTSGKIAGGPHKLVYRAKTKKGCQKAKDGKVHSKEITVVTDPYWLVRIDHNGFYVHFSDDELTFI
jgi:hypothetical protein